MRTEEKTIEKRRACAVELVKAAGQEVISRAEDIVGKCDGVIDLSVILSFAPGMYPSIEVRREHMCKECVDIGVARDVWGW